MNINDPYELYRDLNGIDLEMWRATLAGVEREIAYHSDLLEKAKREARKRVRQDAVADVLWAARSVFDDVVRLLESKRSRVVAEIARIEAEEKAWRRAAAAVIAV